MIKALWSLFGGLSSRGRRQRRGGDAAPSGSGDLPKVPYFDPRGGGPPPGVGGKRRSPCHVGLLLRPAHWPIQVCGMAPHRTARSPRTASFAHHFTLIKCRCTVPQVAAMVDRQHRPQAVHPGAHRGHHAPGPGPGLRVRARRHDLHFRTRVSQLPHRRHLLHALRREEQMPSSQVLPASR